MYPKIDLCKFFGTLRPYPAVPIEDENEDDYEEAGRTFSSPGCMLRVRPFLAPFSTSNPAVAGCNSRKALFQKFSQSLPLTTAFEDEDEYERQTPGEGGLFVNR
jgi:hypothetical protein